jgi:hypothetical protein
MRWTIAALIGSLGCRHGLGGVAVAVGNSAHATAARVTESLRQLKGVLDEAWAGGRIKEGLGVFDD